MPSQASLLSDSPVGLDDPSQDLYFDPGFLSIEVADRLQSLLTSSAPWEQKQVYVGGAWRDQPRLICWMGDRVYTYSRLRLEPVAFAVVPGMSALAQAVAQKTGVAFNCCLGNLYRDGRDSIGMHADDEPELGSRPVIASVSLGATRTFKLVRKDKSARLQVPLTHGSLLVMRGDSQRDWMHGIDKEPGAGARINLTFRRML